MSERQNISDAERDLYELSVEEAIDEVSRAPKGNVKKAEEIIQQFLDGVDMHQGLAVKFRGEVLRKVADQKRQADDEREQKILEKFEGQVVNRAGELRFAGTDENSKFYARAGSIFRRIFGKRYSAAEASDLLHDVQELEDDIEQNQLRLDMLEASYEASRSVIGNMRKIRKAKREGRFVVGYWDDTVTSWKAAKGKKARATEEYETKGKKEIKVIKEKSKELKKQKNIVEEIQKKVEAQRKNGRNIFEQQFGKQIEILPQMNGPEQKREEARLRKDVRIFGTDLGITYMEYFLNEALDITPKTARVQITPEGTVLQGGAYQVPLTERETAEEMATLSRWYESVLGKIPSRNELAQLIDHMRNVEPRFLAQNLENQRTNALSLHMLELRFLITGVDMNGRPVLDESRRVKPTPENIVRLLRYADEHDDLVPTDLQEVFTTFAEDWPDEYTAEDFGYVFDYIKEGREAPEPTGLTPKEQEKNESIQKALQDRWLYVTGDMPNEQTIHDLLKDINTRYNKESAKNFHTASRQFDLMKFFYTGKFGGHDILVDSNPFYEEKDVTAFMDAFNQANSIFVKETPSDEEMVQILRKLQKNPNFQRDGMKALDVDLFQQLMKEVASDEEARLKAQAAATVVVNAPAPAESKEVLSETVFKQYEQMILDMTGYKPPKAEIHDLDRYLLNLLGKAKFEGARDELLNAQEHHEIVGFFISGVFDREQIATKDRMLATPKNIARLYSLADSLLKLDPKPTKKQLKGLFEQRKGAVKKLAKLPVSEIEELLKKIS